MCHRNEKEAWSEKPMTSKSKKNDLRKSTWNLRMFSSHAWKYQIQIWFSLQATGESFQSIYGRSIVCFFLLFQTSKAIYTKSFQISLEINLERSKCEVSTFFLRNRNVGLYMNLLYSDFSRACVGSGQVRSLNNGYSDWRAKLEKYFPFPRMPPKSPFRKLPRVVFERWKQWPANAS